MSLCVCVYTTYIYIYMLSIQVVWELFPLWTIVNMPRSREMMRKAVSRVICDVLVQSVQSVQGRGHPS